MAAQIHSVKDFEFSHSLEMSQLFGGHSRGGGKAQMATSPDRDGDGTAQEQDPRREKSMGIMSQRFLMLFLTSPVSGPGLAMTGLLKAQSHICT